MTVTFQQVVQRLAPVGGPLVGRADEMEALREAWAQAAAGAGGMVLLAGDPGVGKTRLAAELAGEVEATGACVLVGTCPASGAEPYHALVEALGPLPAGEQDRDAMLDTLAGGVVARARRTPTLLVLDDLHRSDRSTLRAVRALVERAGAAPMLIVATYRDTRLDRAHPLAEFLAAELPRPEVERVRLQGLSETAVVAMVGDADLGRRMWRQSAGNPVWVAELLRSKPLPPVVPTSFDELVTRRVGRLTPVARSFLQAAAVSGSEFSVDVAAAVGDGPAGRAAAAMKQLVAAGFVVEEPAGPGDARRYAHEMVREAVERSTPPAARVHMHLRIGRALERRHRAGGKHQDIVPAALLAWHFRAAAPVGVSSRALRYSALAGDLAMELLAWDEAAAHYGDAIAAAIGVDPTVRADLLLSLGEAQRLAGEAARARQAFLEAATMARSCADGSRMARAALALGQVDAVWGADPDLEAVASEARALLGQARVPIAVPPPALAPATDFASEWLYDVLDGVAPAQKQEPEPAPAARPLRDHAEAAALLRARHVAMAGPEHAVLRLEAAQETVALARETDDLGLAATGYAWSVADALEVGRVQEAVAAAVAHGDVAKRLGLPRLAAEAATWTAMWALLEGREEAARSAITNAFAQNVDAGDLDAESTHLLQRCWLALEWGTAAELSEIAQDCRLAASKSADSRRWRSLLALAYARSGQLDRAAEELRRVTDHGLGELSRDPGRALPLAGLVEVAWAVNDARRAAMAGALLEPFADRVGVAGGAVVCHGSLARACGLAAAATHRWDDAERHFRTALGVNRSLGAEPLLARTRYDWSTVLLARGRHADRRRAADARRKAAERARAMGMTWLSEDVARAT